MKHAPAERTPPAAAPLSSAGRAKLTALVRREGEAGLLSRLHLSRHSLARALAGLPIYPGTRSLIENTLDDVAAAVGFTSPTHNHE